MISYPTEDDMLHTPAGLYELALEGVAHFPGLPCFNSAILYAPSCRETDFHHNPTTAFCGRLTATGNCPSQDENHSYVKLA
jgi:hypothetical protein